MAASNRQLVMPKLDAAVVANVIATRSAPWYPDHSTPRRNAADESDYCVAGALMVLAVMVSPSSVPVSSTRWPAWLATVRDFWLASW